MHIVYEARLPEGVDEVLIPGGIPTPHGCCTHVEAKDLTAITEATTGQRAYRMTPLDRQFEIRFRFDASTDDYPDALFVAHPSRFTRFADDLVSEIEPVAAGRTGLEQARAIAYHVAERFTYGHVGTRFNDGMDAVPALGCGLTTGSCVDINTYFIACLRASGIEVGYATGFFFPEEKGGTCEDGHCWVVTRIDGETQEWDIAHHLKLGTRDILPGLNPKPGQRFACFHSMGLDFPELGIHEAKALIEPMAVASGQLLPFDMPRIHLVQDGEPSDFLEQVAE